MVKAVFIDYMGTTVDEHSPEMAEIVRRICKCSRRFGTVAGADFQKKLRKEPIMQFIIKGSKAYFLFTNYH